eukprot:4165761-Prymnesium_polylepis.1
MAQRPGSTIRWTTCAARAFDHRRYARPAQTLRSAISCTSASARSPHLSNLTVTASGCAQASYVENLKALDAACGDGICCCWMWRDGDLPEMFAEAHVIECWISGETVGEVSFASIEARLERTAGHGRTGLSWPCGWVGSGLTEWACDVLLQAPGCPWTRRDGWLAHQDGSAGGDAALAKVVSLLATLVFGAESVECSVDGLLEQMVLWCGRDALSAAGLLDVAALRSCLRSPQTAFPGGSAPRQLTSAEDGFTWLVRGLTLTTRRKKNRARASWRHLPSAFSVKPGFSRFQDT